jgi:LIVCS family branched-chain amino acid:cation transporter
MIILILLARFIPTKPIAQQIPIIIVSLVSIVSTINTLGLIKLNVINHLPLKQYSLEWLPIAIISIIFINLDTIYPIMIEMIAIGNHSKEYCLRGK